MFCTAKLAGGTLWHGGSWVDATGCSARILWTLELPLMVCLEEVQIDVLYMGPAGSSKALLDRTSSDIK